MSVKTIKIVDVIGSNLCIAADDGQKLFNAISIELKKDNQIQLSFEGIEDLTSAFLNSAIGQLYKDYSEEDLNLLKRVVDRAKEYYKSPGPYEKAAKEMLGEDNE